MKKSININIQGLIFNIEEDGFERLKNYIDALKGYFKTYQDSDEIINDIENRIAEIFQSMLTPQKEVITIEDVEQVIGSLGEIEDFEQAEAGEENAQSMNDSSTSESEERNGTKEQSKVKKLYRDENRKILGGVASGIASYFGIDPVIVRIILIIATFGLNISFGVHASIIASLGSITLIGYIVLWAILPTSNELDEYSKLYRDDESSLLGGVASGIAHYVGIDPVYMRLIFIVITLFGGSGILIYLILWCIVPKARTVSERVQMHGKPLTVDNIEKKIKDNFDLKDGKEEPLMAQILFFPFRLIGRIIKAIGPGAKEILKFAWGLFRFVFAFSMLTVAVALIVGGIILLFTVLGVNVGDQWVGEFVPPGLIQSAVPSLVFVAAGLACLFPAFFIGGIAINLLTQKNLVRPIVLGSFAGAWILCLILGGIGAAGTALNYKTKSSITEETSFKPAEKKVVLDVNSSKDFKYVYDMVDIRVLPHSGSNVKVVKEIIAQGRNELDAKENAEMISYGIQNVGDTILFDKQVEFREDAIFRCQRLKIMVYVPEGVEVEQTEKFRSRRRQGHYRYRFLQGTLKQDDGMNGSYQTQLGENQIKNYSLSAIKEITINNGFDVLIKQSDKDSLIIKGPSQIISELELEMDATKLTIDYDSPSNIFSNELDNIQIELWLTNPSLMEFTGAADVEMDLDSLEGLSIEASGAVNILTDVKQLNSIRLNLSGASEIELIGKADQAKFELSGASKIDALQLNVNNMEVELSGASSGDVYAIETLKANVSGASNLKYEGRPKLDAEVSGVGSVDPYSL